VSYPTVEALAAAAGSTPAQVEGMLALGLLEHRPDGFRPADITRVRLVDAAEGSGIMPELIADVVASGRYSMGWVDDDYIGIDQGPIVLMIANHRSEFVWKVMRGNPHIRRGLERAGFTGGWLGAKPAAPAVAAAVLH